MDRGMFSCPRKPPSPHVGNPVGSRSSEPHQAEAEGPPAPPAHQLGMETPSPGSGRQRTREMTTERHTLAPGHSSPQTSPPRHGCAVTQLPPLQHACEFSRTGSCTEPATGTGSPKPWLQHRGKRWLQHTDQRHPQFCPTPLPAGSIPCHF